MSDLQPLKPIAVAKGNWPPPGDRGTLLWIAVDRLRIDPAYQRPVLKAGLANIKRMVEEFSWSLFAPLIVAPRPDGTYAVIDGQHRAIAAITRSGIAELPALSIEGVKAVEARAFATINGMVTRVSVLTIHRAMVAAGDKGACEVDAACAEAGVTILSYPKTDCRVGETLAAGTIKQCLKKFGREILIDALRIVTRTGDGNPGMLREGIIQGGCDVLSAYPVWRAHDDLLGAFKSKSVTALYRAAITAKAEEGRGANSIRSFYAEILTRHLSATLGMAMPRIAKVKPPAPKVEKRSPRVVFAAAPARSPAPLAVVRKPQSQGCSDAVAAFFAKGGKVTKVADGDTGNPQILKDYLVGRGVEISFLKGQYFHRGRKIDVEGLRRLAANERQKQAAGR